MSQAKEKARLGKLDEAIAAAREALRENPRNAAVERYIQQVEAAKAQVGRELERVEALIRAQDFLEAQRVLTPLKNAYSYHPPVQDMDRRLGEEWRAWESKVNAALGEVRLTYERRDYKEALELIEKTRKELKLLPSHLKTLEDAERYCRELEGRKQKARELFKSAEAKLRAFDYDGAVKDLKEGFQVSSNLWNIYTDKTPQEAGKLQEEALRKQKRLTELMAQIRHAAGSKANETPKNIYEEALKALDEADGLKPGDPALKDYRSIIADKLREKTPVRTPSLPSTPTPRPTVAGDQQHAWVLVAVERDDYRADPAGAWTRGCVWQTEGERGKVTATTGSTSGQPQHLKGLAEWSEPPAVLMPDKPLAMSASLRVLENTNPEGHRIFKELRFECYFQSFGLDWNLGTATWLKEGTRDHLLFDHKSPVAAQLGLKGEITPLGSSSMKEGRIQLRCGVRGTCGRIHYRYIYAWQPLGASAPAGTSSPATTALPSATPPVVKPTPAVSDSNVTGTWQIRGSGAPGKLEISRAGSGYSARYFGGWYAWETLADFSWDPATRTFQCKRPDRPGSREISQLWSATLIDADTLRGKACRASNADLCDGFQGWREKSQN